MTIRPPYYYFETPWKKQETNCLWTSTKDWPALTIGFTYMVKTPEERYYVGQCTSRSKWKIYGGSGVDIQKYYVEHGTEGVIRMAIKFYETQTELNDAEFELLKEAEKNPGLFYNRSYRRRMNDIPGGRGRTGIKNLSIRNPNHK